MFLTPIWQSLISYWENTRCCLLKLLLLYMLLHIESKVIITDHSLLTLEAPYVFWSWVDTGWHHDFLASLVPDVCQSFGHLSQSPVLKSFICFEMNELPIILPSMHLFCNFMIPSSIHNPHCDFKINLLFIQFAFSLIFVGLHIFSPTDNKTIKVF